MDARFFDRFGFDLPVFDALATWTPYVEVYDKGNEFVVKAELPGLKKEDINVEISEGALTIFGERSYHSFLRTIALPEGVEIENATATVKDGVLEVKMPMAKLETPRRRLEISEGPPVDKNTRHAA